MGPFWILLALILPFTIAAYSSIRGDIWWNLSTGRWIVENRALPTEYPFTFAPQAGQFYDTQWLAHLAYYAIYEVLGLEGVVVANALVVTAAFAFVLALTWSRCRNRYVAAVCLVACGLLAASNLQPRAQTFGFLFFAATFWLLAGGRRPGLTLLALGAVQALWTNMHGSFFLGMTLSGLLLAGETAEAVWRRRRGDEVPRGRLVWLGSALLVQSLATLATPAGVAGFIYAYGAMTDPTARQYGEEWLPPTVTTFTGGAFFVSVAVVASVVGWSRKIRPSGALILLVFGWFGLQAVRNAIWWGMAITPILAASVMSTGLGPRLDALERRARTAAKSRERVDRVMAFALAVLMISALPWFKAGNPIVPAEDRAIVSPAEPEGAARFAEAHALPSRVFAPQVWGAYLGWRLWPAYSTMVGPIVEIHPSSVWADYLHIAGGGERWEALLDRYRVDLLMLDATEQARLAGLALASGRWREVYADGQARILLRAQALGAETGAAS